MFVAHRPLCPADCVAEAMPPKGSKKPKAEAKAKAPAKRKAAEVDAGPLRLGWGRWLDRLGWVGWVGLVGLGCLDVLGWLDGLGWLWMLGWLGVLVWLGWLGGLGLVGSVGLVGEAGLGLRGFLCIRTPAAGHGAEAEAGAHAEADEQKVNNQQEGAEGAEGQAEETAEQSAQRAARLEANMLRKFNTACRAQTADPIVQSLAKAIKDLPYGNNKEAQFRDLVLAFDQGGFAQCKKKFAHTELLRKCTELSSRETAVPRTIAIGKWCAGNARLFAEALKDGDIQEVEAQDGRVLYKYTEYAKTDKTLKRREVQSEGAKGIDALQLDFGFLCTGNTTARTRATLALTDGTVAEAESEDESAHVRGSSSAAEVERAEASNAGPPAQRPREQSPRAQSPPAQRSRLQSSQGQSQWTPRRLHRRGQRSRKP